MYIKMIKKEKKAYHKFNGKTYTLYKSGTKKEVKSYVQKYSVSKNFNYRIISVNGEYRLYMIKK